MAGTLRGRGRYDRILELASGRSVDRIDARTLRNVTAPALPGQHAHGDDEFRISIAGAQDLIVDNTTTTLGGVHHYDHVIVRNHGTLRVLPFDGVDRNGTGNLVLIAQSITRTATGEVFTLRYAMGCTETEIARATGLSLAAVKTRAHRAKLAAKKACPDADASVSAAPRARATAGDRT